MDSAKLSGGGNEPLMEETVQRQDSVNGERHRDTETRETDVVDGTTNAADINHHHRGSADKQKFGTLGYQRRTKQKAVTDFASVSKGASAGAKPRAALRQVLFNQGVSDKTSEERGQLDVLKQELEAFAVPVSLKWKWNEENQGTVLEKNWTEIVRSHSTLSKMHRHQQEALWEFVHTELTYINKLIIIKDLVIASLLNLHQHGFLLEVTTELLFCNLPSILCAHKLFWQEVIYPMLQEVRQTGQPFDPMTLETGCLQFHERFSSYQHYCWEEENNLEFTRRQMESNPQFLTYVQWVETHPQCERMRFGDMQAKPHQRITKYPLLLKAVLKNTQDPHVQHTLRGMLSSVNSFLENINDYLRLKDEELALSISAQRVEGYEVEGINEEIDKHVREICHFDLTCPIRGVGPGVIRKLLLEENLKVRNRKDNKLELVALLFSDVLLLTKFQKKGERLKVVRPPLALDRTYCTALKDGYAFVLVEVGELQSAKEVLILVASTAESCSKWVSTIHQAKETLMNLREKESNRLETLKIHKPEARPLTENQIADGDTEQLTIHLTGEVSVDSFTDEFIFSHSINGSKEAEHHQPPNETPSGLPFWHSQSSDRIGNHKSVRKSAAGQQTALQGQEWIEMGVRRDRGRNYREEENKIVESQIMNEQVSWNHRTQSVPNLDFTHSTAADPFRYNTNRPHSLLLGGLPDVDYPTNGESTLQPHDQPATSRERPEFIKRQGRGSLTRRDSDSLSVHQDDRRNSSCSQSDDLQSSPDAWTFSKNLKSPRLRRRRPVNTNQDSSSQTSNQSFQSLGQSQTASNHYSSSNSDSDYNLSVKRNSLPSDISSDSVRVLKLGSLKSNQGMFWNICDRVSPDPQTLSEPELPEQNPHNNRSKMKTQRSASIPNIVTERGQGLRLHSSSMYTSPQPERACFPISGNDPNGNPSPVEGILERARERQKDKGAIKRDQNVQMTSLRSKYPPPSPSFSTTSAPPPSDRDKDGELEEVGVMRHRVLTVSKGWKEQLVDEDDDEKRNSVDGENVDWSGWCFDDDEVMDHLHPGDEGLLEGISRSLPFWDLNEVLEQDDGECSQV
ncbi:uncharacterized protein plekhg6 [Parambassis ranga]|uniref:Uncharacterized protein plekhg6 n=1 Tax=Parambassis ranga TaxID=210632 RepID=A0A6P7JTB3_9TELE|nr:pleckstrin homology domain-containing family G member 6 [Parambassis ranga]